MSAPTRQYDLEIDNFSRQLEPLRAAQREAIERVRTAESAVTEANARLEADLRAGRETSTSRRVLYETMQLHDKAIAGAKVATVALKGAGDKEITRKATALMAKARESLTSYLSQFSI